METDENQKPGEGKEKEESTLVRWCKNPRRFKFFAATTLMLGVLMTVVGFPKQIFKNWEDGNFGLDITLVGLPILIFIIRTPYNIAKDNKVYIIPDMIGLAACLVLLWQYFHYNGW